MEFISIKKVKWGQIEEIFLQWLRRFKFQDYTKAKMRNRVKMQAKGVNRQVKAKQNTLRNWNRKEGLNQAKLED